MMANEQLTFVQGWPRKGGRGDPADKGTTKMITDLKATTEKVLKAGGKLPRYLTNLEASKCRSILKSECRRLGISPVACA